MSPVFLAGINRHQYMSGCPWTSRYLLPSDIGLWQLLQDLCFYDVLPKTVGAVGSSIVELVQTAFKCSSGVVIAVVLWDMITG